MCDFSGKVHRTQQECPNRQEGFPMLAPDPADSHFKSFSMRTDASFPTVSGKTGSSMESSKNLPSRRSVRLPEFDYAKVGMYFVTICATQKRCIFGRVNDGQIELAALGQITCESWIAIPLHFARVNLHVFVIMPNHLHGILEIAQTGLAQHAARLQREGVLRRLSSVRRRVARVLRSSA